jgi:hypothetical protein
MPRMEMLVSPYMAPLMVDPQFVPYYDTYGQPDNQVRVRQITML